MTPFGRRIGGWAVAVSALVAAAADLEAQYVPPPESQGGWRSLVPANAEPDKGRVRKEAGLDWDKLAEAWRYASGFGKPNSLLVVRHGWIAGEWHTFTGPAGIASCKKSLVGLAFAKLFDLSDAGRLPKKIGPDDLAWPYLPASWSEKDPAAKRVRIRHLLTMTSGVDPYDGPYGKDYPEIVLRRRVLAEPGAAWAYATVPVDLLCLVLENVTGESVADFFNREVNAPLGIPPVAFSTLWNGGGTKYAARDLARIGYLMLRKGTWGDRAIVSSARVEMLTRWDPSLEKAKFEATPGSPFPVPAESPRHYGHLWWTNRDRVHLGPSVPADAFFMSGYGKVACFVAPSLDLVVVRLGTIKDLNDKLDFYAGLMSRVVAAASP